MSKRTTIQLAFLALAVQAVGLSQLRLTVTPASARLHVGNEQQFAVAFTGTTDQAVNWAVNGITGGNATLGTINATGRYAAPAAVPSPNFVTITAIHRTTGTDSNGAGATLLNPYPMLASVRPARVFTGPFGVTINGSGFVRGAQVRLGAIALATTFVSATRLVATGTIGEGDKGDVQLSVVNPEPGGMPSIALPVEVNGPRDISPRVTTSAAARFLEQAAFGPDRASIEDVQRLGLEAWLDEQLNLPASPYQDPGMIGVSLTPLQARYFSNAVHGRDQLRQRVAFALAQIWVVSGSVASTPERFVPYLRVLQKHAFGNYRDLMRDMTLCPAMGDYLNMVNNVQANTARGTRPNENFARELLQLFTLGPNLLNRDGTYRKGEEGNPIPSYTQKDIQEISRALTGWTYPTRPGAQRVARNPAYYDGPMEPWQVNHDTAQKTLLHGVVLSPGQTAEQDLDAVLDNLFYHGNIDPFVCKNLIQHLVKSNPSPEYVERVVKVFDGAGGGARGDLRQVIRAILLDPEARAGDDPQPVAADDGHLREPVLWMAAVMRALGAMVNDTNNLASRASALGQNVHFPPTVFNYYMPGHTVSGTNLLGPEFQILTPSTAIERANQVNAIIYGNLGAGATIDLNGWAALANSPNELLDEVDLLFFHGQMPAGTRRILLEAIINTTGERAKAQAALYLAASSSYFAVQH